MATVVTDLSQYDKIINVELFSEEITPETPGLIAGGDTVTVDNEIVTPDSGCKPDIVVSGELNARCQINSLTLRIKNLYNDKLLSDYKAIRITTGYRGKLKAAITGQIFQSYPESPPPDGVVVFEVLIGQVNEWYTAWFNKNYTAQTPLITIMTDIASVLGLQLMYRFDDNRAPAMTKIPLNFNCMARDALLKLKGIFATDGSALLIRVDYNTLIADELYSFNKSLLYDIDYTVFARKDAAGFNIKMLYDPRIQPCNYVRLNPSFYKQSFGGQNIAGSIFRVVKNTFSFGTTDSTNEMNLMVVEQQNGT